MHNSGIIEIEKLKAFVNTLCLPRDIFKITTRQNYTDSLRKLVVVGDLAYDVVNNYTYLGCGFKNDRLFQLSGQIIDNCHVFFDKFEDKPELFDPEWSHWLESTRIIYVKILNIIGEFSLVSNEEDI